MHDHTFKVKMVLKLVFMHTYLLRQTSPRSAADKLGARRLMIPGSNPIHTSLVFSLGFFAPLAFFCFKHEAFPPRGVKPQGG
jgi:Gpi18-like mannosyltransferase